MKILIVEDEESFRFLLYRLLNKSGHFVLESENGEHALAVFAGNNDIDLVITDFRMPCADGIELIGKILNHRRVRIWLVSNAMREETKQQALSLGAEIALEKENLFLELVGQGIVTDRD